MKKYRRSYKDNDDWGKFLASIFVFYAFIMFVLYISNRAEFWRWFLYSILFIISITAVGILFLTTGKRLKQNHLNKLLGNLRNYGQEEYLKNFISRFALEDGKRDGWSFRNHHVEWGRFNDLKKILGEKKVTSNTKDISAILKHYIQEKEEGLTRESIKTETQKFDNLSRSGSDFEKLLSRLFEAMNYKVESIGRSGDQGGDLIANKNGERVLIQAKNYINWSTGNAAVQQVAGAQKFYDCNKTMVFTTSHFTPEAISLAKANNTELVSRERLQEMLSQYLKENWV